MGLLIDNLCELSDKRACLSITIITVNIACHFARVSDTTACQRLEISPFAVYCERSCTLLFIIPADRSDASFDGNAHNITDDSSMPEEDDWGQESGVENLSDLSRLNITSDSRILEESIAEEPEQVGRWEGLIFSFLIFNLL